MKRENTYVWSIRNVVHKVKHILTVYAAEGRDPPYRCAAGKALKNRSTDVMDGSDVLVRLETEKFMNRTERLFVFILSSHATLSAQRYTSQSALSWWMWIP